MQGRQPHATFHQRARTTEVGNDGRFESRRELGSAELLMFMAHQRGALLAASMMQISGPMTPQLVRRGLDWLQDEHPILRAHVVKQGMAFTPSLPFVHRRAFFVTAGTERIPLRSVVDPDPETGLRLLQEELRRPIPLGRNPRMRAVLVRASEVATEAQLITCTDHTIADVQSAMRSLDQLLSFFAHPEAAPIPRGLQQPLPPALEDVLPPRSDRGKGYEPLIRLPVARLARSKIGSAVETRFLGRADTEILKAEAKAHRATLHGVVTAAILNAIHGRFGQPEMTCLSSVDLRRLCRPPIPNDVHGCYVDLLRTRHEIGMPLWELARDVAKKLLVSLARDHASSSMLRAPSWEMVWKEAVPLLLNRLRVDGLVMTAGGAIDLGTNYGQFRLEGTTGMITQEVLGAGIFCIALERQGSLEISLCYAPHCLAREDATAIADDAIHSLGNLVPGPESLYAWRQA
jgi:hypothetical protein